MTRHAYVPPYRLRMDSTGTYPEAIEDSEGWDLLHLTASGRNHRMAEKVVHALNTGAGLELVKGEHGPYPGRPEDYHDALEPAERGREE